MTKKGIGVEEITVKQRAGVRGSRDVGMYTLMSYSRKL